MASLSTCCAAALMLVGLTAACSEGNSGGSPTIGGDTGGVLGSAGSGGGGQAPGSGGVPAGGKSQASGGASTGGASVSGGPGSGGQTSSSGGEATGGALPASGGAPTGGTGASGASSGGRAGTGGVAAGTGGTGGTGTGGVAAGSGSGGGAGAGTGGSAAGSGGAHESTPSSGCSVTDVMTGTTIDLTMNLPGQSTPREYRLSVPADYVPGEPLPVVFVLNGVGGTGPQAQQFFQVETGHRAIFVYPTSLPNDEAGGSIAWDFSLDGVDVPFFDEMVSTINESYCVDTSRIFALGASSGGIMSNMLGCFRGDVFRGIAPSSGMTWQQSGCKGDVGVIVICGEQDSFNPCDDAQNGALSETNVWVPLNGCTQPSQMSPSPLSDICEAFQGCGGETPLLLCTHAGGHGWPTSNGDFWWQFFMSLD